MKKSYIITIILVSSMISFFSCKKNGAEEQTGPFVSHVAHPEWSKSVTLYEVNVRQFTEEGTFNASS